MVKIRIFRIFLLALIAFSISFSAHAGVVWDESGNGDLSNDGLSPTPVVFTIGSNIMNGTVGNGGSGVDRDYFTFTVPSGMKLNSIMVTNNTTVSGSASFFAIQKGLQVTTTPTGGGVTDLLGFTHYGNDLVGTDILPVLVPSANGSLASGTYSIWVQETGGPASYGFDFVFTATTASTPTSVPLPLATQVLLFFSLSALALMFRSKSRF
jgi:hypothetical protein